MSEVFCKEKINNSEFVDQCAKKYLIEKDLQRKSRIILQKESEFQSVRRIMERFKDQSHLEFDTIFKLYKLQRFNLDIKYFKGSTYKYATLNSLKAIVKSSTFDDSVEPNITTHKIINDFIRGIKPFSKPFCKNLCEGKKIKNLLSCGSLSAEEIDFINSEIVPRRIKKEKVTSKIKTIMEDTVMSTAYALSKEDKKENYRIILENASKKTSDVAKLISNMSARSVENYLWYSRTILSGKQVQPSCPKLLIEVANENLEYYINRYKKAEVKLDSGKKVRLKDTVMNNYKILVNNYKKGIRVVKELLPNMSYKSLTTYISYLNGFDRGNTDKKHCPTTLYELWKEHKEKGDFTVSEPVINKLEESEKVLTKPELDCSTDTSQYVAFIYNNGLKELKASNDLSYLKGYAEAYKEVNDVNIKIYQLIN